MLDYDRSMEDELQSTVNSVSSIASSIASFASSIGIGSFNGNKGYGCASTTPDPPLSSSIPTDSYLKERGPSLKRVTSSPSRLAMEGKEKYTKRSLCIGILLGTNGGKFDFEQLKTFIFDRIHFLETQAMNSKTQVLSDLIREKSMDEIMGDISDHFLCCLNTVSSGRRVKNMWQAVHLGGLVGSRCAKNNIVDIICELHELYEGERYFMSSVVTAILSANSTWHSNICQPVHSIRGSIQGRKILDLYGGPSSNFPVRITFVSREETLLQGFLALTSYFQRNTIFVQNDKRKHTAIVPGNGAQVHLSEFSCCSEAITAAVNSALSSNSFSFLEEEHGIPQVQSSETITSSTSCNGNTDHHPDVCPRFSTAFVDYPLSRRLYDEKLIAPNHCNLPIISDVYHPSAPIMGLSANDGVVRDFKNKFSGFHNAMKLSTNGQEIVPKMIINDALVYNCKVYDGTSRHGQIHSSTTVRRILKNFIDLKRLTGNNKLCLIYLESELQTLSYIREAYLTFCQHEPSPPKTFLDIFDMDKSDGEMFNLIM